MVLKAAEMSCTIMQKRILAINDLSCMGKCSLTTALPIISAFGHECVALPTALLSTHTAEPFGNPAVFSLTEQMRAIFRHWDAINVGFDAIYTGYITDEKQSALVLDMIDRFMGNGVVIVDPVLGDNGSLYRGFSQQNVDAARRLCGAADIITPNLTEAALLAGIGVDANRCPRDAVERLIDRLVDICRGRIVITGVCTEPGVICTVSRDIGGDTVFYEKRRVDCSPHGSGDIFAATLTAAYLCGRPFTDAVRLAADFTSDAVKRTAQQEDSRWYGLDFEPLLGDISRL